MLIGTPMQAKRAISCPLGLMRLLILKELGGQKAKKRARNGPFATAATCARVAPLIPWYGWGRRI